MADASYAVSGFLGGEVSQFYQGRFDRPDYKASLNVCFNSFPVEIGTWVRRPGTIFAGTTRGGLPGRVTNFDFEDAIPYTIEWTDGHVRFRQGARLATNNDSQAVIGMTNANPGVFTVTAAWASGATIVFSNLGTSCPQLQNRQFLVVNLSSGTFSLTDPLTGTPIDTTAFGTIGAMATAASVQDLTTVYAAGAWNSSSMRVVQAETTAIPLNGTIAPQALTVSDLPTLATDAAFAIGAVEFEDGPYLDPFTNGALANPNQTTGIVQLTLSFPPYVSTTSYAIDDLVTSSSVNYISLIDQNIGHTPASSPTDWAPVDAGAAVNGGKGFLQTDIDRLIRLYSEPAAWAVGSTYTAGNVVAYNPTGVPGATTYWQALTGSNTGNVPGADLTNWELVAPGGSLSNMPNSSQPSGAGSGPAQWTWGKIVSLANFIPGGVSGVNQFGDMTLGSGLAGAFDGNTSKAQVAATVKAFALSLDNGSLAVTPGYVGQNYSGTSATGYKIAAATIFPTTDASYGTILFATVPFGSVVISPAPYNLTAYLYANTTAPGSDTDGTLLGQAVCLASGIPPGTYIPGGTFSLVGPATTITSNDQSTTWSYVWVRFVFTLQMGAVSEAFVMNTSIATAQVEFIEAAGSAATAGGVNVELLGPPLLYTTPIRTWRLGVYSDTTSYPTCGCYADGRIWLGGAVANRYDACVSNGIDGRKLNFAPTDQFGTVSADNGISYTLNSDSVNPIFWMQPDQQGIILGTQAGEILLYAPTAGGLAPNNIAARKVTKIGCANIEPKRTEHTNVFVHRYGIKLMEYFPDVFSGKFTAPNLADKAQHITRAAISELAYQQAATPIVWGRCGDGSLFGMTYKRDTLMTSSGPTFYAWHRHGLGSGRILESITGGPSPDGTLDSLAMVTNQATVSDPQFNVRHVEILTDATDELTPAAASWYLDDAGRPSSTTTSTTPVGGAPYGGMTLNGLWHLNGKTVTVFAAGLDCGDFAVSAGSVFVPFGDGVSGGTGYGLFTLVFAQAAAAASQIVVGFTYTSQGQLVRPMTPAESGARNGPALGKKRRVHQVAALLNNVGMTSGGQGALSFGTSFTTAKPAIIKQPNGQFYAPLQPFSGVWFDSIADESSFDGMVCWQITRPYPANVIAIEPFIHTQDK
jgi:hypothetical protein